MKRPIGLCMGFAVAFAAAAASAQGAPPSAGDPPAAQPPGAQPAPAPETQPPPPPGTQPPSPPGSQPPPPGTQPPPPGTPPPPGAYPPPAYPPGTYPPGAYPPGAYPPGAYPPGYGYPPPPPKPPEPEPVRTVSLTLSPLHLIFPLVELMGEVRPVDHLGLALIGGYGSVSVDTDSGSEKFKAYELGAQVAWYPMKPFDGFHVGAEALYVHVEADDLNDGEITGAGQGVGVGPMIGYKVLTRSGFTFLVQGGIQYVAVKAEAKDTAGNSSKDDESRWIPLLNLNLGYSF